MTTPYDAEEVALGLVADWVGELMPRLDAIELRTAIESALREAHARGMEAAAGEASALGDLMRESNRKKTAAEADMLAARITTMATEARKPRKT